MRRITYFIIISGVIMTACAGQKDDSGHRLRAGVFSGNGASNVCVTETMEALKTDAGITPRIITAREIAGGILQQLDVIIFPGGSGSKEANNLGAEGMRKVRDFVVRDGKGIVGICAGAYLLSDTPDYPCLHVSGLQAIDRVHDARGGALACVTLHKGAAAFFPELKGYDSVFIQYNEGPMLIPADDPVSYQILAEMRTDVHAKAGAPAGMTPGKPYLIASQPGKGRAFLSVGHPESTPGMRWLVPRMVRWTAGKELVSYDDEVVRPGRDHHAIIFDPAYRRRERAMFWQLFDNHPGKRIEAMKQLHEMRSRAGVRWTVGMLRDTDPQVRSLASALLAETEYTDAIPDLEQAVASETGPEMKKEMIKSLKRLKKISYEE